MNGVRSGTHYEMLEAEEACDVQNFCAVPVIVVSLERVVEETKGGQIDCLHDQLLFLPFLINFFKQNGRKAIVIINGLNSVMKRHNLGELKAVRFIESATKVLTLGVNVFVMDTADIFGGFGRRAEFRKLIQALEENKRRFRMEPLIMDTANFENTWIQEIRSRRSDAGERRGFPIWILEAAALSPFMIPVCVIVWYWYQKD
jgi:hypothetical protein